MVSKTQNNSDKTVEKIKNKGQPVKVADIDIALRMLKRFMDTHDIKPLLSALETLKTDTQNETYQAQVIDAFNDLQNLPFTCSIFNSEFDVDPDMMLFGSQGRERSDKYELLLAL